MRLDETKEVLLGSAYFIITTPFPRQVQPSLPSLDLHHPILLGMINHINYQERRVVTDRKGLMRCGPRELCSRTIEYSDNGDCVPTETSPSEFATERFGM